MNMNQNKLLAGFLVAGILAMSTGYIAKAVINPEIELAENAYVIEVAEASTASDVTGTATEEVIIPLEELIAAANIEKGKKAAKACTACHSFDQGGKNKTGPALFGIVDKAVGADAGYKYSNAMKDFGGTWTVENLNQFLIKPKLHMPGTKMSYAGIKKDQKRADLIAWLQTLK